jgi:DNA-binding beta-propeller fold protein YncE
VNQGNGEVYVVDNNNHRIQRFDASGGYLGQWGTAGSGDGQFDEPAGIAIDPVTSQVYVTDSTTGRVQRFSAAGVFELDWGSIGSGAGQFTAPYGIAVDSMRRVYVGDAGSSRIQRFTSDGSFQLAFGSTGSGPGQFGLARGIAILPGGYLTVVDAGNSRVSRWRAIDPGPATLIPQPPVVTVKGKKRIVTSKATITIRGTASDPNSNLTRVEVRVGPSKYRRARGLENWRYKARLKIGSNKIQVRAVDATALPSRPVRLTVTRR